jgi:hypothetical protein
VAPSEAATPPPLGHSRPVQATLFDLEELEHRDRQGFERRPDDADDDVPWEQAAQWPEE